MMIQKKRAQYSQIVRAKENLELNHGRPSQKAGIRQQPTDQSLMPGLPLSLRSEVV